MGTDHSAVSAPPGSSQNFDYSGNTVDSRG